MLVHHPFVVSKAKPLHEDEVFGVHERLVRAAEAAGYEFNFLDPDGDRLEAFVIKQPTTPLQNALIWAVQRVRPARTRVLRARGIEKAADREQAIRDALAKDQCAPGRENQKLSRCLGSRRRRAPPPNPHLCGAAQLQCTRKQPETAITWQKPAVPITVNVEELVPTLDDRLRDKAMEKTRSALSELRSAANYFDKHASKVEWALRVLRHDELPERKAAKGLELLAQTVQEVLNQTDRFDGYPDIRNASDWEAALSDIGMALRDVGCSGRDVARWLRGNDDPDRIAAVENKVARRRKQAT